MKNFVCGAIVAAALGLAGCSSSNDGAASTNDALSQDECAGTADTDFCARNAADGARHVRECWQGANAPWRAYLDELAAARDDAKHPELAQCAEQERLKTETELRRDCAKQHDQSVCDAIPQSLLRFMAETRCYSDSPEYAAKNARFFDEEAAYLVAASRCVGLWVENTMLSAGCYLLERKLSGDRGTASASCLAECPAEGEGAACVPKRYRGGNDPVPCGVYARENGVCECQENTSTCARYEDAITNPRGLAVCETGVAIPHVVVTPEGKPRMEIRCESPPWHNE